MVATLKKQTAQLLARANDPDEKEKEAYQRWAAEAEQADKAASACYQEMENMVAIIECTDEVARDKAHYQNMLAKFKQEIDKNATLVEGAAIAKGRYAKFLA